MDQADSCRRAAFEAVADVEPPQLHDRIEAVLEDASMVPGVLTLESAAATAEDAHSVLEVDGSDQSAADHGDQHQEADRNGLTTQAAGVQLIYEGLGLTRSLAQDEPWTVGDPASAEQGDLDILAADILVARGFYLLARTDAAGKAVRTVQAFGRDQTRRSTGDSDDPGTDPTAIDATLEHDILELAVLTGSAAVSATPSPRLLALAESIADTVDATFPPASDCLADFEPRLSEHSLEDHATDRTASATDS